ncbi:hypothetical protein [Candidatus Palauibacter soopunensis]|uniref:McrC family protein n=1 Tax=Candidatus Palauibacter soopunensis TaxID=3056739 RepID=UPI00238785D6|nr:hypothetical protein [Candidatus Palauibacter soopunensis]MDE2878893.1 hypothetical protein [Candidatus Palauibacter soopunensis]
MLPTRLLELTEWDEQSFEGISLLPRDRRLAEQLREGPGPRLIIDELRTGIRVRSRAWVGVARFDGLEIRVHPKLAGDYLDLATMIEVATGLAALKRSVGVQGFASRGSSLFDLVALLHVMSCEAIARGGFMADYIPKEEELGVVRGRLLVDRQVFERFGHVDRLICAFDDHHTDIPDNQILAFALRCSARRVTDPRVRQRVRRMLGVMVGVCDSAKLAVGRILEPILYNRRNEHYRESHALSRLIVEGLGVSDVLEADAHESFAFMLDMNVLFERFVDKLISWAFRSTPVRVSSQHRDRSIVWDEASQEPYSTVAPDLIVETTADSSKRLPIDAKYKLYDDKQVSSSDLYQAFLYAVGFANNKEAIPAALLVYPSSSGDRGHHQLSVRNQSGLEAARVRALAVDIPAALNELRSQKPGRIVDSLRREAMALMCVR